jgi:hypothetical protein
MADVARFSDRHAPYRIYRRKTARVRQGRRVYTYYVSVWDPLERRYGPGRSTGQTTRAAAERWVSFNLDICCKCEFPIAAKKILQALGGEF